MHSKAKRIIRVLVIVTVLISNIGCDQISKNIVRSSVHTNEQISLIKNYLTLTKVENTGAFLSVGDSLPVPLRIILLSILPVAILALALMYVLRKNDISYINITGICFIVGGGLGNIYDRIVHGSVTDFLHIDFVLFQTGIFNLADVSIMVGMFITLSETYLKRSKLKYTEMNK